MIRNININHLLTRKRLARMFLSIALVSASWLATSRTRRSAGNSFACFSFTALACSKLYEYFQHIYVRCCSVDRHWAPGQPLDLCLMCWLIFVGFRQSGLAVRARALEQYHRFWLLYGCFVLVVRARLACSLHVFISAVRGRAAAAQPRDSTHARGSGTHPPPCSYEVCCT